MPRVDHETLEKLSCRLLRAAGTPDDIATRVAFSLVDSNLKGVDSHGVVRLPGYLEQIRSGEVKPAARPSLVQKDQGTAVMRGAGGFGIYAIEQACDLVTSLAHAHKIAAVGVIEAAHTGRIGQFAEKIAAEGLFAMIFGGGAHEGWSTVAPYGGAQPVMSTNPYAYALPRRRRRPLVVDFATSAVSRGKLLVEQARGEHIPKGWILDKKGRPSTNPADILNGGMQLPAGGHKGYGMGLIAELLCFAMLKSPAGAPLDLNWMIIALDMETFRPLHDYHNDSEPYLAQVKATPPAKGFDEVLLPGDPEARCEAKRRRDGIDLPAATWTDLCAAGKKLGLEVAAT